MSDFWASSSSSMTVSLWTSDVMIQCTFAAVAVNTLHSCTSDLWTVSDACSNSSDYKLVIDNDDSTNGIGVASTFLQLQDGDYFIEAWCVPDDLDRGQSDYWGVELSTNTCSSGYTAYDSECIDNEYSDCTPARILLYFDTDVTGGITYDAQWYDATDFCIEPVADGCLCTGVCVCEPYMFVIAFVP